ncbi:MAG: hypothetical protein AAF911_05820 [Planctomycetota bacterium]
MNGPIDHEPSLWQAVADDADLMSAAADCDPTAASSVSRLRKTYPAERVAIALELVKARAKAAVKFPQQASALIADAAGVEQATSLRAATHKAQRLVDAGFKQVIDLCCGVGGDAMGFTAAGLGVTAVDRHPTRAWMAERNAGCASRVLDAKSLLQETPTPGTALHLDPARRTEAGRVFRLADYQPDPKTINALLQRYLDAGIKLSPAVNLAELEEVLPVGEASRGNASGGQTSGGEVEFISEGGRLVQAVLWTGRLASGQPRTATLLADGQTHTLAGTPAEPDFAPAAQYLYTVDPAVERAGLLPRLDLPAIHPRLGLLTADTVINNPWLTGFELLAELPYSTKNPKKIKAWLADHDAGLVEIKTRGKAVDPDPLQRALRGQGATPYTLFILRFDQRLTCLVTRRLTG